MSLLLEQTRHIREAMCPHGLPLVACSVHLCDYILQMRADAMCDGFGEALDFAQCCMQDTSTASGIVNKLHERKEAIQQEGVHAWGCGTEIIAGELAEMQKMPLPWLRRRMTDKGVEHP